MEYMPEPWRGSAFSEEVIKHSSSHVSTPTLGSETKIVHIGRRYQKECVITVIGAMSQKALWDCGAGRCIISYDCYNSLHPKYKTELFPKGVKMRAANGTFVSNRGECEDTFKINKERFTFPFLCLDQLSQQMILGHNFYKAFCIGRLWNADDVMFLTRNGMPFAETMPTQDINALVFCMESTVILPYSNGDIKCRLPRAKGKPFIGRSCVFETSFKHRSLYSHCNTYEGLVTVDDTIASSGVFNIVMTNKSNRHIKIHSSQTIGMLHSCEDSQICTFHGIVSFARNPKEGRDDSSDPDTTEGNFYYVYTRNPKMGRLEVNTLPRKDFYPVQVNETGPQHDYMHYRKPGLLDALADKQTRDELDRLLEVNHDAFADYKRQIGITLLINMSIDTEDHPPIAKKPYALALRHYDWVRDEIDKLLEAGVI